ncbi:MAG: hypothetical protein ISS24_02640 [Candidatus Omnitrophica bacterium]|nr:hypothetical protein [Candidatus Omnitrophota bacterium]
MFERKGFTLFSEVLFNLILIKQAGVASFSETDLSKIWDERVSRYKNTMFNLGRKYVKESLRLMGIDEIFKASENVFLDVLLRVKELHNIGIQDDEIFRMQGDFLSGVMFEAAVTELGEGASVKEIVRQALSYSEMLFDFERKSGDNSAHSSSPADGASSAVEKEVYSVECIAHSLSSGVHYGNKQLGRDEVLKRIQERSRTDAKNHLEAIFYHLEKIFNPERLWALISETYFLSGLLPFDGIIGGIDNIWISGIDHMRKIIRECESEYPFLVNTEQAYNQASKDDLIANAIKIIDDIEDNQRFKVNKRNNKILRIYLLAHLFIYQKIYNTMDRQFYRVFRDYILFAARQHLFGFLGNSYAHLELSVDEVIRVTGHELTHNFVIYLTRRQLKYGVVAEFVCDIGQFAIDAYRGRRDKIEDFRQAREFEKAIADVEDDPFITAYHPIARAQLEHIIKLLNCIYNEAPINWVTIFSYAQEILRRKPDIHITELAQRIVIRYINDMENIDLRVPDSVDQNKKILRQQDIEHIIQEAGMRVGCSSSPVEGRESKSVKGEKERLVEKHIPLVKFMALRMAKRLPAYITIDDLIGYGDVRIKKKIRDTEQN